jgi:Rrf2 family protein
MKLITRDTDYALRALVYIALRKNRVVSASELVSRLKIPRPFLRKLLQRLNKKGIVKSYKGQGGGFTLASDAKQILLTDLIETFQGRLQLNECLFKKRRCPDIGRCPLHSEIEDIEKDMLLKLSFINLASLASKFKRAGMH